jgi:hypothetical protein
MTFTEDLYYGHHVKALMTQFDANAWPDVLPRGQRWPPPKSKWSLPISEEALGQDILGQNLAKNLALCSHMCEALGTCRGTYAQNLHLQMHLELCICTCENLAACALQICSALALAVALALSTWHLGSALRNLRSALKTLQPREP